MEIAVSNTTVLILLGRINRLDLLKKRFTQVLIPPAVVDEIKNGGEEYAVNRILILAEQGTFIRTATPKKELPITCGPGERAAISLAHEKKALFLSDDKKARRIARSNGIPLMGTVGIVLWHYQNKTLTKKEVLQIVDDLLKEGCYLSSQLYSEIVQLMSEQK